MTGTRDQAASVTLARGGAFLAATAILSVLVWRLTAPPLAALVSGVTANGGHGLTDLSFPLVLAGGSAVALVGCWVRLAVGSAAVVVHAVLLALGAGGAAGPLLSRTIRLCPQIVRRVLLVGLGVALTTAAVAPGYADSGHTGASGLLSGLDVPDRTTGLARAAGTHPVRTTRGAATHTVRTVGTVGTVRTVRTVRTGDSLWAIAARLLPHDATDHEVARASGRIYESNRDRLGPDPDLIHPGTRLSIPDDLTQLEQGIRGDLGRDTRKERP